MAIGFYYPTFAGATTSWVTTKQPAFPLSEPVDYPEQLVGQTAGGTLYVQDKGVIREKFVLNFDRLPEADRDDAYTFFIAVKKAYYTFEYSDRDSALHTVRWMNNFDFTYVVEGRYSGIIQLREEV